ncbi:two-component system OmpR family response regulator/two-component system response regulator TctD [Rhizobium subbaraonis]|uniref:Two-component system OmpR family response regulator/two-component system response regulator TctD n=1 Tax=Rhizobium subbaraonis TaxID=908946 RepID=A0A285UTC6_9HYPH|nr:response regulator transcription factor [Rhizobium subbaraonis]SOC45185.1 two-component system OmpR family response regulator/two-component system response regulator TctD [Rhizobium subbaraonis]
MRSLIVEDNPGIAAGIQRSLEGLGHAVDRAASLPEALDLAAVADYELVVLDLNLRNDDGLDFLRHLRRSGKAVAVLILTARSGLQDRVRGLDLGADDYLVKPFELAEFEARIRALARRLGGVEAPLIRLGLLSFDIVSREARVDGVALDMPARERALLQLLAENAGSVVPKERITARLSGFDDELTPNAIEIYVHRLRKRLDGSGCQLRTARGLGYMLDAG